MAQRLSDEIIEPSQPEPTTAAGPGRGDGVNLVVEALCEAFPRAFEAGWLEHCLREAAASEIHDHVERLTGHGFSDAACALALAVIEQTLEGGRAQLRLAPVRLVPLLLGLHAEGRLGHAGALTSALYEWREAGIGTEAAREALDRSGWRALVSLDRLPDDFPQAVRATLARAALGGDVTEAAPELRTLADERPDDAQRARELLRRHSPDLHTTLGVCLVPSVPDARSALLAAPPAHRLRALGWVALAVLGMAAGSWFWWSMSS